MSIFALVTVFLSTSTSLSLYFEKKHRRFVFELRPSVRRHFSDISKTERVLILSHSLLTLFSDQLDIAGKLVSFGQKDHIGSKVLFLPLLLLMVDYQLLPSTPMEPNPLENAITKSK